ncbi:hypothetical protein [Amaricoccus sp. W119]|uniref:COG3904 family protein n=1 Tax=Amaricoccus sp. W119 TaxID=3391833 RepID=UPI0039A6C7C6
MRWILVAQIALAIGIMGGDVLGALPDGLPRQAPAAAPDVPVSPGDQTRRFLPDRMLPDRPGTPGLPASEPLPRRLAWNETTIDGVAALDLAGTIAPGDAARFVEYLDGRPEPPRLVTLRSPGGSVTDALAIGRRLRAEGIGTRVERGAICLSSCPYLLAGGVQRAISRTARVGVHQHFFGRSTVLPAFIAVADIQRGQAEVLTYLDEMGVDPMLAAKAMATPSNEIYILVPEESEALTLATTVID